MVDFGELFEMDNTQWIVFLVAAACILIGFFAMFDIVGSCKANIPVNNDDGTPKLNATGEQVYTVQPYCTVRYRLMLSIISIIVAFVFIRFNVSLGDIGRR